MTPRVVRPAAAVWLSPALALLFSATPQQAQEAPEPLSPDARLDVMEEQLADPDLTEDDLNLNYPLHAVDFRDGWSIDARVRMQDGFLAIPLDNYLRKSNRCYRGELYYPKILCYRLHLEVQYRTGAPHLNGVT